MKRSSLLPGLVAALCMIPWLIIQPQLQISGDAAWYIAAMKSFLAGGKIGDAYFDSNPPLSYLLYLPAALITRLGITPWTALNFWMMGLIALSLFLLISLLRGWSGLGRARLCGLLAVFIVATLLVAPQEFAHKDQMVALFLLPFLLAQFAITYKLDVPRWIIWTSLIAGAPFILVKPHYGLLPFLMLAHRLFRQRRWTVILDADFLALGAGIIIYAAVIALWFPAFITDVLPYSLEYYVGTLGPGLVLRAGLAAIAIAGLIATAVFAENKKGLKKEIVFLNSMAIASVIPFLTQLKGYNEQMAEMASLMACAGFLNMSCFFRNRIPDQIGLVSCALILLIFGGGYYDFFDRLPPSRQAVINSPLARLIRGRAAGSSFYMQDYDATIYMPVSLYTGIPYASRFSTTTWFLPFDEKGMTMQKREKFIHFFGDRFAEDFARYKPALVMLLHNPEPGQDLIGIFGRDPAFAGQWRNYRLTGSVNIDRTKFYLARKYKPDYARYDLYERVDAILR
jgi:hypothetical protein